MFGLKSKIYRISIFLILLTMGSTVVAKDQPVNVLEPMDLSSPQATLNSFLTAGDNALQYFRDNHWKTPSKETAEQLYLMTVNMQQALDLSKLPPAAQFDLGRDGCLYLYEVLSRLDLPAADEIPTEAAFLDEEGRSIGIAASWMIPHTEIAITRIEEGEHTGQFRFSSESVSRAEEFYKKVSHLTYTRNIPVENFAELRTYNSLTGWLISPHLIEQMPQWLKQSIVGQAIWKWITLLLMVGISVLIVFGIHRISRRGLSGNATYVHLRRLATPIALWALMPAVLSTAIRQLTLTGVVAAGAELTGEFIGLFSLAWIIWIVSILLAEVVISSPRIGDQSLNAHLLRLVARCVGILGVLLIFFHVSERMGAPLYSLVAGLGVGGIAIALATQNTIENFVGSLNLFADAPVRVGDFCRYGEDPSTGWKRVGTIEAIGLRSTRIRGIDHTLTTIPNSEFSRLHLINYSRRDSRLFLTVLKLRYETTDDQLRFVLVELRKMLIAHPRVTGDEPQVRFKGIGDYAFKVEIRANIDTENFLIYRGIQEDILLRIMKIVKDAGTGFAYPARTVYHTQDKGLDKASQLTAEEQVRQWCDHDELPFPGFTREFKDAQRNTLDYPPMGSPKSDSA